MIGRKLDKYIADHYAHSDKALLLTGARQVGKSFAIRKYGKKHYENYLEINFLRDVEMVRVFQDATDVDNLLLRLSAVARVPLVPHKTFVFLDEVQAYPDVMTWVKFLVEDGNYRYALSGSLLGTQLKDIRSMPVGFLQEIQVYPLDFEEFIGALGVSDKVVESVREAWENQTPVDNFVHEKWMQLFRLYLIVGGMPEVVQTYMDSNNLQNVWQVQQAILGMYRRDIAQYDAQRKLYIQAIFDLIPSELNAQNKRFVMRNLNAHFKLSRYENDFIWLQEAGVALPTFNVEKPRMPLLLNKQHNLFKLFQNDVGLLACQYANGIQMQLLNGETDINYGAIYENVVAQELRAHGFDLYYFNSKKVGEVDFVVEYKGGVLPIEVKSGKDYRRHAALDHCLACADFHLDRAIVLCNGNVSKAEGVLYAPIYMVMWLHHRPAQEAQVYKVDLSGLP